MERTANRPALYIARAFGRFSARHLPEADVLVAWSGAGVEAFAAAKRRGMLMVLERGSTHIAAQNEILRDAYAQWDVPVAPIDARLIDRELSEYEHADLIVTGSAHARASFIDRGIASTRVVANPYGVDLKRFHPRSPSARPNKGGRILFVGEIGIRKGVPWLLDAIALLPPAWELHLVGPLAPGMRDVLARRPTARVVLRGVLSGQALADAYREADIFCLPSIEEGFGMVILQAMASGVPVVASAATGGPDVGQHGRDILLVPPADTAALAEALGGLIHDSDWRRSIGAAGAARVEAGFSWDDYGRRAVAILQGLVRRSLSVAAPAATPASIG